LTISAVEAALGKSCLLANTNNISVEEVEIICQGSSNKALQTQSMPQAQQQSARIWPK